MEKNEKMMNAEAPMPSRRSRWMVILLFVIVFLGVAWYLGMLPEDLLGSSDRYQAVFLTNDQVYFGKLSNARSQFPVIRDVYYLQITQALQPSGERTGQDLRLVKLGNELHGPKDEMFINRDQILFYEDLKPDSQIVLSIQNYKKNLGAPAATPSK